MAIQHLFPLSVETSDSKFGHFQPNIWPDISILEVTEGRRIYLWSQISILTNFKFDLNFGSNIFGLYFQILSRWFPVPVLEYCPRTICRMKESKNQFKRRTLQFKSNVSIVKKFVTIPLSALRICNVLFSKSYDNDQFSTFFPILTFD